MVDKLEPSKNKDSAIKSEQDGGLLFPMALAPPISEQNVNLVNAYNQEFNQLTQESIFYPTKFFSLEIDLTYQCNQQCPKCLKLCNNNNFNLFQKKDSLSLNQIKKIINEIKAFYCKFRPTMYNIKLIGGEPLLHPHIIQICILFNQLIEENIITRIELWTNGTIIVPEQIKKTQIKIVTLFDQNEAKTSLHNAILVSPNDLGITPPPFLSCNLLKCGIVVSYNGYAPSPICSTYMRIFELWNLFLDHIPLNLKEFGDLTHVLCLHCPFNNNYYGKNRSNTISPTFHDRIKFLKTSNIDEQPMYGN